LPMSVTPVLMNTGPDITACQHDNTSVAAEVWK
jgi:hypothetical protein